jgi:predicted nucleic acid-binding protein
MFTALLDTSVLWPSRQRDFLLSLAAEHFYRPIWSAAILEELEEAETEKLLGMGRPEAEARQSARYLVERMRAAFDDAEVEGWEPLVKSFGLRDPDDEHVLAAAVVGQAGAVVTSDRDFEAERLPPGMQVLDPAEFAFNNVALNPGRALVAVEQLVSRLGQKGPVVSVDNVLDQLVARYRMNDAVDLMRAAQHSDAFRRRSP